MFCVQLPLLGKANKVSPISGGWWLMDPLHLVAKACVNVIEFLLRKKTQSIWNIMKCSVCLWCLVWVSRFWALLSTNLNREWLLLLGRSLDLPLLFIFVYHKTTINQTRGTLKLVSLYWECLLEVRDRFVCVFFTPMLIVLFCNGAIRGSLKTLKIKVMGQILHIWRWEISPPELIMLLFIIFNHSPVVCLTAMLNQTES